MDRQIPIRQEILMKIKAAELLIKYLEEEGVEYVFEVPGGVLEPINNALYESKKITPVLAKHEEGAALMACGYARVSGKLGVCMGTTGPGSTNMMTGVASAYGDSTPVMVLTGQVSTSTFGKGALQESTSDGIDVVAMYKPLTKYSAMVFKGAMLPEMVRRALRYALSGRQGPVHLNLPRDVMKEEIDFDLRKVETYRGWSQPFDRESVKRAATYLLQAERPAMLLGNGTLTSDATDEAKTIAEMLNIPVVTTPKAKSAFPSDHPLSLGPFGLASSLLAEKYLEGGIDVLLTVGTSFTEWATQAWDSRLLPSKALLQIDIDPYQIGKNYPVTVGLVGDANAILTEIYYEMKRQIKNVPEFRPNMPMDEFMRFKEDSQVYLDEDKMNSNANPIKPQRLMRELRESLPKDAIVFIDIGNSLTWTLHYFSVYYPNTFMAGLGFAPVGYGVASVIGGKFAVPDKPVIAIVGDGGFLMNGMEVATAVNYNMPVIWVILNDAQLGMVYHGQRMASDAHVVASKFKRVDFFKIAEGLGAKGIRIEKPGEINKDMMDDIIASGKPTVLDVIIDSEEPPPMKSRIEALEKVYD
ncbi:MAG: thiamine pyrophosphate-binding protein [Desulfobacterales bacterium]|nr:thiamine pyrophosphate-binding protein [Desulfobacterales bacterium]